MSNTKSPLKRLHQSHQPILTKVRTNSAKKLETKQKSPMLKQMNKENDHSFGEKKQSITKSIILPLIAQENLGELLSRRSGDTFQDQSRKTSKNYSVQAIQEAESLLEGTFIASQKNSFQYTQIPSEKRSGTFGGEVYQASVSQSLKLQLLVGFTLFTLVLVYLLSSGVQSKPVDSNIQYDNQQNIYQRRDYDLTLHSNQLAIQLVQNIKSHLQEFEIRSKIYFKTDIKQSHPEQFTQLWPIVCQLIEADSGVTETTINDTIFWVRNLN